MANEKPEKQPQDKAPEEKRPLPLDLAEIIKAVIGETLPVAVAVAAKTLAESKSKSSDADIKAKRNGETCQACSQRDNACLGEHKEVVLFAQSNRNAKFFPGCIINGVRYLSNSRQHKILVPKRANVEVMLADWERCENDMVDGRSAEHNSGFITMTNKSGYRQAHSAWR